MYQLEARTKGLKLAVFFIVSFELGQAKKKTEQISEPSKPPENVNVVNEAEVDVMMLE